SPGRRRQSGAFRMGGADLQCLRGTSQSGESVLDATAGGHPKDSAPGLRWLHHTLPYGSPSGGILPLLAFCAATALRAAGKVSSTGGCWGGCGGVLGRGELNPLPESGAPLPFPASIQL